MHVDVNVEVDVDVNADVNVEIVAIEDDNKNATGRATHRRKGRFASSSQKRFLACVFFAFVSIHNKFEL